MVEDPFPTRIFRLNFLISCGNPSVCSGVHTPLVKIAQGSQEERRSSGDALILPAPRSGINESNAVPLIVDVFWTSRQSWRTTVRRPLLTVSRLSL
jgi:hypothetical protein